MRDNVALAGGPSATPRPGGWESSVRPGYGDAVVTVRAAAAGTAHDFVTDSSVTVGSATVPVAAGQQVVHVPLTRVATGTPTALVGGVASDGSTLASSAMPRR